MSEIENVTQLCVRLGSSPEQARIMAAQLLKRADQIAAERGIRREDAMAQLLQILVQGRQGEVPAAFKPSLPSAK
ncbi:MAG TPA: hypothetical protein VHN79_02070 [Lacunisphaera sp.]|nr:hypothetical protein [Lacunisphaera sp.]